MSSVMPSWIRWIDVDSSGSRKPADKADGDHILVPEQPAPAGLEVQLVRGRERAALRGWPSRNSRGLIVGNEVAAIHVAVAHAMLQRNPPLPAGRARRGARQRHQRPACFAGNRHGAIARQPLAPVFVAGLELLLDEQAAKARAVDEQVGAQRTRRDRASRTRRSRSWRFSFASTTFPSVRTTPLASEYLRRKRA